MSALEKLGEAICQALDEEPIAEVLAVITGSFVGLTTELARRAGHDVRLPIKIDGGENRDITIHAAKGERKPEAVSYVVGTDPCPRCERGGYCSKPTCGRRILATSKPAAAADLNA